MAVNLTRYWEDYEIGETFATIGRTLTEAHVVTHAGNTGDLHELQMNAEYARRTPFGQRLVHAPLVYAVMEGLINSHPELRSPETNICYYGLDRLRLPAPVFIGDTVSVTRTVMARWPKSAGGGIVKFRDEVRNQHGTLVLVCETLEYLKTRPA
jgi:acyl dehydratase